jgi:hypothetical protein
MLTDRVRGGLVNAAVWTWPHETLLVNSPCPKFHALGAGFIQGMYRVLADLDSGLQA